MENKDKENISLKTILVRYLLHWKLFLIVFILSFIPAIFYLTFYPRTYSFASSILLQEEKESSMSSLGLSEASGLMKSFGIGIGGGSINVDDEMEILSSNRLLRKMIHELGINVVYTYPYSFYKLYNDAPLKLTADTATLATIRDEYRFTVSVSPGQIKVIAKTVLGGWKETYIFSSFPATMAIGKDVFTLDLNPDVAPKKEFKLKIKYLPASWLAEDLGKKITIEDVSSLSNVLTIDYDDHSMQRGLDMLNTLVKVYNEDMVSYKRTESHRTTDFLNQRIDLTMNNLIQVEADIEDYKQKNDMTLLEADVTFYTESYKEILSSIFDMEFQSYQIDMLDDYVKDPENKNKVVPSIFSVTVGEVGVVAQYNKMVVEQEKLLNNSNENNDVYKSLNHQVEVLHEGVIVMLENTRKSTAASLADLKSKESDILSKMKTIPAKEREYISYKRNQDILQAIYLMLLQKKEETVFSIGNHLDRARVIEPAFIKKKTVGPRKLFAGIGILLLTLVIPVGYLFGKDLFVALKEEYKRTER